MEKANFLKKMRGENFSTFSTDLNHKLLNSDNLSESEIAEGIESTETKVFKFENIHSGPDAKRVMLESTNPYTYGIIKNIIDTIKTNPRCKSITVIADAFASKEFSENQIEFSRIQTEDSPVLVDMDQQADVCLAFLEEPTNSPLLSFLYSAKSIYGVEKLFVYFSGPALQSDFKERFSSEKRGYMDEIDGIITPSKLSAMAILEATELSSDKVFIVKNPAIETVSEQSKEVLRSEGREKLELHENEITLLYLGFPSEPTEAIGMDPALNLKTLKVVIDASIESARKNPKQSFAVVIRAHPRDQYGDKMTQEVPKELPQNLRFVFDPGINYEEAIYASDGLISTPLSSEISLAPYRGRTAIMPVFSGKGLTRDLSENVYSKNLLKKIGTLPNTNLVKDADDLATLFSELKTVGPALQENTALSISEIILK